MLKNKKFIFVFIIKIYTSLLVVNASQTINFPSCDVVTICLLSFDQSIAKTLPWWPFKIRRDFVANGGNASSFSATVVTNRKKLIN